MAGPLLPLAPAERAVLPEIQKQAHLVERTPALARVLNTIPTMAMILNRQRQLVFANRNLLEFAGAASASELLGLRPGEVLDCIHACETPAGCGTTEFCSVCGSLQAILNAQLGRGDEQVCRIRRQTPDGEQAVEFNISAAPLELEGEAFTLVYVADASHRLRREWFEHAFVPRAAALAQEVDLLAAALANPTESALSGVTPAMVLAAARRLMAAFADVPEMPVIEVGRSTISAFELLSSAARDLEQHPVAQGRCIAIDPAAHDVALETAAPLVRAVLAGMLLNALEAIPPGADVRLGCRAHGGHAELWVHNPGEIPRRVQLQIFQRGFSTKGPGRGYGTYTMRLIATRGLRGAVDFRSSAAEGTTFSLRLPVSPEVRS